MRTQVRQARGSTRSSDRAKASAARARDDFDFSAGAPSLEFLATGGRDELERFESFRTAGELGRWLSEALMEGAPIRATEENLHDAKTLRDAIRSAALATIARRQIDLHARQTLNGFASDPPPAPTLGPGAHRRFRAATAAGGLSLIARDAIDLLTGSSRTRLRICANESCALIFLDTSRGGIRRWCSMQRCGNRAKAAAFLRRTRGIG